ncbi:MAG: radical SAM protein [Bacilli bacterium]
MSFTVSTNRETHILRVRAEDSFLHFDRTGRFLRRIWPDQVIRRGLDGRLLLVKLIRKGKTAYRAYRDLPEAERETFLAAVYRQGVTVLRAHRPGDPWIKVLERWSPALLAEDKQAFDKVYLPISILPPDQYNSLVIQVAHGCSYNQCLFCDFYRDRKFHIKSMEELQRHIGNVKDFFGDRLADRSGIFLADGNALVIPTQRLTAMLDLLTTAFAPGAIQFSTFMDTFNAKHKSAQDLQSLRAHGLDKVYVGLETGANRLRAFLHKPGTAAEAAAALTSLKEAGFRLGVIILVGAGGRSFAAEHMRETLDVLKDVPLTKEDTVFLSPFVEPGLPEYGSESGMMGLTALTEEETGVEMSRFKQGLRSGMEVYPPKITLYSIREHLY